MLLKHATRPYPIDLERQTRCRIELAKRGMSMTALGRELGVSQAYISQIISGRDRAKKAEAAIARFLRLPVDYLFPVRTNGELMRMQAEEKLAMA